MNVVAIVSKGRSGALLLQSLLDSHPRVCSMPASFLKGYIQWYGRHRHLETEALIRRFLVDHPVYFDRTHEAFVATGLGQMGDHLDQHIAVDPNEFLSHFRSLAPPGRGLSRRDFFVALNCAYARTTGQFTDATDTIVYYVHDYVAEDARALVADFPQTKFLHMLRKPIQTSLSLINHFYGSDIRRCRRPYVVEHAFGHLSVLYPLVEQYREQSRFVKLEDLHRAPEATMRKVVEFLELGWDDCLLKSTMNGVRWWNFRKGKTITGFSSDIVQQGRFQSLVTRFDRQRLSAVLSPLYPFHGYEREYEGEPVMSRYLACLLTVLLPFKFELLAWKASGFGRVRGRNGEGWWTNNYHAVRQLVAVRVLLLRMFVLARFGVKTEKRPPFLRRVDLAKAMIPKL